MMATRKNTEDCYFFLNSSCVKGDQCPFRHSELALRTNTVCSLWREGKCFKRNCQFRHGESRGNQGIVPCFYDSQPAGCQKSNCRFVHLSGSSKTQASKSVPVTDLREILNRRNTPSNKVDTNELNFKIKSLEEIRKEKKDKLDVSLQNLTETSMTHLVTYDVSKASPGLNQVPTLNRNLPDSSPGESEKRFATQMIEFLMREERSHSFYDAAGAELEDLGTKTLEQIHMEKMQKESDGFYGAAVHDEADVLAVNEASTDVESNSSLPEDSHRMISVSEPFAPEDNDEEGVLSSHGYSKPCEKVSEILSRHSMDEHELIASTCKVPIEMITFADGEVDDIKYGGFVNLQFQRRLRNELNITSFKSILSDLDQRFVSEAKKTFYFNMLQQFLKDSNFVPNISVMIYLIIENLLQNKNILLHSYLDHPQSTLFLLPSEKMLVLSIIEIQKDENGISLIENTLSVAHHALLSTKKYPEGVASLSRFFAELCKMANKKIEVLKLCIDLLILNHRFSTYLIASLVGVFPEIFMPSEWQSEDIVTLLRVISVAARKKHKKLDVIRYNCSLKVITDFLKNLLIPDVTEVLSLLEEKIISSCSNNNDLWLTTSAFAVLATVQPQDWIKSELIEKFILPQLERLSKDTANEKIFRIFCNLLVDVYCLNDELSFQLLLQYFQMPGFVQHSAALAIIRYLILKRMPLEGCIAVWVEKNQKLLQENLSELYLRRNILYCRGLKKPEDIIII
ncbi:unnamed protein product [Larinioides sclopetarius]|uniref:C3H1-type domain-containing protein n=1 Tax=Larinioides sclopetarius TaxID=280406 RepID=A0AAV2B7R6_9ARAC